MWPETWDMGRMEDLISLGPAAGCRHKSCNTRARHSQAIPLPIPWLTHHWKHRVGITAADLDTMDSVGPGLCMVCGDMWASNGHNEGLRV
jgi:hypothetical protein